ncbi:MAG: glycosyltransferase family 4 protein [Erysipelotrichaceae bacterium]|nr:glycosyltransferase family 4 protein [Erysipelotrichaceae bacterium]
MVKVCWISNIPSPYKVHLMNLLSKDLELYILFEKKGESDREDSWYSFDFKDYYVEYLDTNSKEKIDKASEICDVLINGDYSNKQCIYAVNKFKKQNKPVIMLADGGLAIDRGFFNYIISYFMKKNDYFMSSGKEVNKYYKFYGVNKNRIYNYKFSSLTKNDIQKNKGLIKNKSLLKQKLNLKEDVILFSVGQQIPRKGYDLLVKAMIGVNKNVGLYIAGGEPEENVKDIIKSNNLNNIYFVGFKTKEELDEYYAASDIFVLSTRYDIWGLVINEAMSFGLPIISSDKCVSAIEFNNLFNNALITKNEDVNSISEAINTLINDEFLREQLGRNSLKGIKEYTIEQTKEDFVRIINDIINKNKKRS